MNAQTQLFCTMLLAMCDEDLWRVAVENAVDASPEEFVWEDDCHCEDTLDLTDDIAEREFIRWGGN